MGAWGFGLFQSDHDYDVVDDLTSEAGLTQLAWKPEAAVDAPVKDGGHDTNADKNAKGKENATPATDDKKQADGDEEADGIDYENMLSIYANHNPSMEAIAAVRAHLEAGKLKELVDKYKQKTPPNTWTSYPYTLVILGACAMSLGCKLPPGFKQRLKGLYNKAGLMDEAEDQMRKALFGPDGYKSGEMYEFGSLGLLDTAMARMDEDGAEGASVEEGGD